MTEPETSPGPTATLVIIPAFNEEEALPAVLVDLSARPGLDVIVVDDGSTDRTAAAAAAEGVTVLSLPFNLGIGGALRTGFLYAVRNGYERAVQFDGDGQHDADEIPTLLAALADGADMVVGSRFAGKATSYSVSRVRARAMGVLRFTIKTLSGQQFTDTSSGFRAFNREFGRKAGDDVLKAVGRSLASIVGRPGDLVARYHRDEFALVLASTDGPGAFNISEQVRQAVEALQLPAAKDAPSQVVTASVATATAVPQRESAWEELDLIKAARHALREARATGGNRVLRANLGMAGPPELVARN